MRKPVDRYAVLGAAGIALVAATTVAFLAGAGGEAGEHGRFLLLARRLGYKIESRSPGRPLADPGGTLLLRLGEMPGDATEGELEAFVEEGGTVVSVRHCELDQRMGIIMRSSAAESPLEPLEALAAASGAISLRVTGSLGIRPDAGPEILARTSLGPYIASARIGKGLAIAVADDLIFSESSAFDPEAAALANGLLSPWWERRILVEDGSADLGGTAAFRALRGRGMGLAGAQLLAVALIGAAALGLRFGTARTGEGAPRSGSRGSAEAVGGFYRMARALGAADRLLAAAFARHLTALLRTPGLSAPALARAAELAGTASAPALNETRIEELLTGVRPRDERALASREARREDALREIAGRLRERIAGKDA